MPMYENQDQLYNWWDPVKSEDTGLLVQNLLRTFWLLTAEHETKDGGRAHQASPDKKKYSFPRLKKQSQKVEHGTNLPPFLI